MIPINLIDVLREGLDSDKRKPDGLLHCSSDLIGSLRHAQLAVAGAPRKTSELVSDVRLKTGTMWHELMNRYLERAGISFMQELDVSPYLPEGWSGTADWLFWNAAKRAFVLGDLKTTKGEGMKYVVDDGFKAEHIWQLSAYYHALAGAKYPMLKGLNILYLPMNDVGGEEIEPVQITAMPLDKGTVWTKMEVRWAKTQTYMRVHREARKRTMSQLPGGKVSYINDQLAAPMERVQKLFMNGKKAENPFYEVKLVPHWTAQFCPYDDELCDCNTQGTTKIGSWLIRGDVSYIARKGYESIEPIRPTNQQIQFAKNKIKKAA